MFLCITAANTSNNWLIHSSVFLGIFLNKEGRCLVGPGFFSPSPGSGSAYGKMVMKREHTIGNTSPHQILDDWDMHVHIGQFATFFRTVAQTKEVEGGCLDGTVGRRCWRRGDALRWERIRTPADSYCSLFSGLNVGNGGRLAKIGTQNVG